MTSLILSEAVQLVSKNMIATQERDQILTQNSSIKENTLYNTYKCSGFYKIRSTRYRRNQGAIIEFE